MLAGRAPDLLPNEDAAAWRMTERVGSTWSSTAIGPAPALNTLLVEDLDAFLAQVAERGIATSPVETIGPAVRRATIAPTPRAILSRSLSPHARPASGSQRDEFHRPGRSDAW
jgi:hypothetical protein